MIKCWNRNNDKYFNSFHIEVLVLQILNVVTISNFSPGVKYYLGVYITLSNLDSSRYGGDVGNYINALMLRKSFKSRS
jgi:hypothetical protein